MRKYSIMEVGDAYGKLVFHELECLVPTYAGVIIPQTLIPNPPKNLMPDLSAYEEANTFLIQPPSLREPQRLWELRWWSLT